MWSKSESWLDWKTKLSKLHLAWPGSPTHLLSEKCVGEMDCTWCGHSSGAGISSQSLLEDIFVFIEVFSFVLFGIGYLVAASYDTCLEMKKIV